MDIKPEISKRITQSRKALGITIKELASRVGSLSAARISNWEQGTRNPGPVEAKLLAKELKVSASYLLCLTDNIEGDLSQSSEGGARFIPVLKMIDAFKAKELLADGKGFEKSIVVDEFNRFHKSKSLFAVIVEDNSMQPNLHMGDVVVIDRELQANPGNDVLVYFPIKNQTVLRKYGEADGCLFQLLASNGLWATISVKNADDARVVGVVVERRHYL